MKETEKKKEGKEEIGKREKAGKRRSRRWTKDEFVMMSMSEEDKEGEEEE